MLALTVVPLPFALLRRSPPTAESLSRMFVRPLPSPFFTAPKPHPSPVTSITATSTPWAPWYVIPADRWWLTQALVAWVLVEMLRSLEPRWPEVSAADHAANLNARKTLEAERVDS